MYYYTLTSVQTLYANNVKTRCSAGICYVLPFIHICPTILNLEVAPGRNDPFSKTLLSKCILHDSPIVYHRKKTKTTTAKGKTKRDRDRRGLYKHLKMTAGLGGRKTEGQQAIKDENGNLLRDKGDILRRWERFFGNLLNTTFPALQPSIVEKVQQRRKVPPPPPPPGARSQIGEPISLEAEPTYAETQKADGKLESAGR